MTRRKPGNEAFDEDGLLRDGKRYRVPMITRDAAPRGFQRHGQVHDGRSGDPTAGNRPGYRIVDTIDRAQRQQAYDAYHHDLVNAYKSSPHGFGGDPSVTGAGSHGRAGDACTINGRAGHLKLINGELQCVPDRQDAASLLDPKEGDACVRAAGLPGVLRRHRDGQLVCVADPDYGPGPKGHEGIVDRKTVRRDPRGREEGTWEEEDDDDDDDDNRVERRTRDHRLTMDRLYSEYNEWISSRWKDR